ncbi:MAG: bacterial Ig-like domain-containing protein [Lactobacillus amylovorus]
MRNKISVAHDISLVKNPNYDFPTRDAINFATDRSSTVIKPCKVNVSEDKITTNEAGLYPVTYSYGKAKAHVTVEVRSDDNEGIVKADKTLQPGAGSATSWFKHFKTSGHWGKSFAPETKSHTLKSGEFHLKTYFYQPAILSQSGTHNGLVGPVPEGLAVSRGTAYTTMYSSPHNMRSHIVAYKLNQIPNRYIMQKLPWMSWNKFTRLASHVKVSPYIKTGHGQAFSATKKNLRIKRIWSFKIWNNGANDGRYIHNAVFINDHTFIAEYRRFEYWKVTRNGDSWIPKEIGATKGDFMFNNSPVQGMAYDKKRKQIYLAFNDYLFKLNRKGRMLDTGSFHTGREFEGICVNGNHFYAELAQRPELLRQRIK